MPHILIVEAPYYQDIANELRAGAVAALYAVGATHDVVAVPGAFEIPAAIALAAGLHGPAASAYDGYVALGCVIRGETTHYDYVCTESARGLQDLALRHGLAIGFGILTVENDAQAWARASRTKKNKGAEAVKAALAMIALKHAFMVPA
ncbi:MAG: 6,7-dimethyl-8-ribityllumazine synthase [Aliidongia sp.]